MKTDDRINPEKNPMPFDKMRMICGRFAPVVELDAWRIGPAHETASPIA